MVLYRVIKDNNYWEPEFDSIENDEKEKRSEQKLKSEQKNEQKRQAPPKSKNSTTLSDLTSPRHSPPLSSPFLIQVGSSLRD